MTIHQDAVIIVGSGPAGTSAALALRARGVPVRILEAGSARVAFPPPGSMLDLRFHDREQWRWQIGSHGEGLSSDVQTSPKFRVPGLRSIFQGYAQANRLQPEAGFHLVGALAAGGLSNAWGCGVARFDAGELGALARDKASLDASYDAVAKRVGLSGASEDELRDYFALDAVSGPALQLDALHARLWQRRSASSAEMSIGRARVAVLGEGRGDRHPCDNSGMCLWGCERRSTWSAALDAALLKRDPQVQFEEGVCVEALRSDGEGGWWIDALACNTPRRFRARQVLLAAGTIASTRLALATLPERPAPLRLLSNPMAAFLLWLPSAFGSSRERSFGLAQLSFVLRRAGSPGFGNLFSTSGLPVNEFLTHMPLARRSGLPLLRALLSSCVVGNLFLPGSLSAHSVELDRLGQLRIQGGADPQLDDAFREARGALSRNFRHLGAWMLPGSFVRGAPGADLHYASTLPISENPAAHECHLTGELAGSPGLYVIDGASLPTLPAKAHTLTLMANADRIARGLPLHG